MILSKPQMFLTKFNEKHEVCCHGNICASTLPTSFKARYIILKSKKISNDQELIQSDPISCPQNQKGNN